MRTNARYVTAERAFKAVLRTLLAEGNYEVGFVAWGIGVMVGLAAWKGGGRGGGVAVACAVLALASIAAGKLGGAWLVRGAAMDEVGGYFTRELYEEYLRDTRDWSELPSDPDRTLVTTFMVEHGYTEASAPSEIEDDEFLDFLEQIAPMLEALHDEPPTYETWAEGQAEASRREIAQAYPLLVLVREGLNGFDLCARLLGGRTRERRATRDRALRWDPP